MQLLLYLTLTFLTITLGRCQLVSQSYSPSVFENIGLGEAPNGVYIPQDSLLNALRNPSYRSRTQSIPSSPLSNLNYDLSNNNGNNNPQQNFYVRPPTSSAVPEQNTNLAPVMVDPNPQSVDGTQVGVSRRKIRRTERISNNPGSYSSSPFQNIALGEVPPGVYIPPDSLLNVLRNTRNAGTRVNTQVMPANDDNFGLIRNYGSNSQQLFVQPPTKEDSVQPNPILPVRNPDVEYVAPSPEYGDEEYGTKLRASRRQHLRRSGVRPSSMALDPSMEYPADVPREEMQAVSRSNVEYVDFRTEMEQNNNRPRKSKRRQSRRKRIQTGVKPDYIEPEYPPRVYGPSEFQNIGLGEAPSGVSIPSDSMLNLLRDTSHRRTPMQALSSEEAFRPASVSISEPMEEMLQPERDSQMATTRRRSRQRSRQVNSSEMEITKEYGSRTSEPEPVQTFRQSSQQRRISHRRS